MGNTFNKSKSADDYNIHEIKQLEEDIKSKEILLTELRKLKNEYPIIPSPSIFSTEFFNEFFLSIEDQINLYDEVNNRRKINEAYEDIKNSLEEKKRKLETFKSERRLSLAKSSMTHDNLLSDLDHELLKNIAAEADKGKRKYKDKHKNKHKNKHTKKKRKLSTRAPKSTRPPSRVR